MSETKTEVENVSAAATADTDGTKIHPIVKYPDPVLAKKGTSVTEFGAELAQFVQEMWASMYAAHGIGLAAPQIGVSKRITVIDVSFKERPDERLVLINPEIIERAGKQFEEEGCLSLPEIREKVQRAARIKVRAQDVNGEFFEAEGDELLARAIQHEIDHLDGVLFIDRLSPLKRDLVKRRIRKLQKNGSGNVAAELTPMRLAFCGTPDFAVSTLEALLEHGHEIALVLTQPDRPAGRKMELQRSAVKCAALAHSLHVLQPEKIKKDEELQAELESIRPDAIIVVAYGRIIPEWMLKLPRFGNINLHGSLLPKYRGAAPIQWAVANGETETGVTTMQLDAGLDTGDILLERRLAIGPETTASELYPQLASIGAKLMIETLDGLQHGTIAPRPQDNEGATLAPILTREDGRMELDRRTARDAYNRWRGFSPWPGAYAQFRGKRFLAHRMHPVADGNAELASGELALVNGALLAGAADRTILALDEVQMEGKARMPGAQFAKDFQLHPGDRLA